MIHYQIKIHQKKHQIKNSNNNNKSKIKNNKQKPKEPEKDIPECILIMGDVHIPNRIDSLPKEITKILEENKNKFNRIICIEIFEICKIIIILNLY